MECILGGSAQFDVIYPLAFETRILKADGMESLKSDDDNELAGYFYQIVKKLFITVYSLKCDLRMGWFLVTTVLVSILVLLGCC